MVGSADLNNPNLSYQDYKGIMNERDRKAGR